MLAKAVESGGSGEPEIWWGFSSCSTSMQPVMAFLGQDPATVRVMFTVEGGSSARDVRRYTSYAAEAEVLMPFGCAFTVVTASSPAPNLLLVTLRQTHGFVYQEEELGRSPSVSRTAAADDPAVIRRRPGGSAPGGSASTGGDAVRAGGGSDGDAAGRPEWVPELDDKINAVDKKLEAQSSQIGQLLKIVGELAKSAGLPEPEPEWELEPEPES